MGTTCGSADTEQFKTEAVAQLPTQDSGCFQSTSGVTGCPLTSPTFVFAFDEALEDEDEMEVVLRVAQRQHGDAAHARVLVVGREGRTEGLCGRETPPYQHKQARSIVNRGFI